LIVVAVGDVMQIVLHLQVIILSHSSRSPDLFEGRYMAGCLMLPPPAKILSWTGRRLNPSRFLRPAEVRCETGRLQKKIKSKEKEIREKRIT
jgi:hypothetical protein